MNGANVNIGTGNSAAIDTGTTLIGAPTTAVEAIWSSVPGAEPLSGQMAGFWAFRTYLHVPPSPLAYPNAKKFYMEDLIPLSHHTACSTSTNLNISMSFGGPSWPISISDLSLGTNNGQCVGAIFDIELGTSTSGSDIPSWIVGDTFLVRFIC